MKEVDVEKEVVESKIRSLKNVPPLMASKYLGMNQQTIRYALQQKRVPFGFAVQNPKTGRWSYHISPTKLILYQKSSLNQ